MFDFGYKGNRNLAKGLSIQAEKCNFANINLHNKTI